MKEASLEQQHKGLKERLACPHLVHVELQLRLAQVYTQKHCYLVFLIVSLKTCSFENFQEEKCVLCGNLFTSVTPSGLCVHGLGQVPLLESGLGSRLALINMR